MLKLRQTRLSTQIVNKNLGQQEQIISVPLVSTFLFHSLPNLQKLLVQPIFEGFMSDLIPQKKSYYID